MKIHKWYKKWWVWILVAVTVVFVVPLCINYCYINVDFCPTDWNGGDALQFYGTILSFIGTVLLGALALWQNKKANDLTVLYEEANKELLKLQTYEYRPKLFVDSFVGVSKFGVNTLNENVNTNDVYIFEGCTNENEISLGYLISLCYGEKNGKKDFKHCRTYELNLKYCGKMSVQNILLESVSFFDNKQLIYGFSLENRLLETSLTDSDKIKLFIKILGCEDFQNSNSSNYKLIDCNKMVIKYQLVMFDGNIIHAQNTIIKKLIEDPGKTFNCKNVELLLSSTYETEDKAND